MRALWIWATAALAAVLLSAAFGLPPLAEPSPPLDRLPGCPPTGFAESVSCFVARMPREGSGGYVAPSPDERAAWGQAVVSLRDECSPSAVPDPLGDAAAVALLHDQRGRPVCVLVEQGGRGWGLVALGPGPGVHHHVPHPLHDWGTPGLAAGLLDAGAGSSLVLAGAHRHARADGSADMSHHDGPFQAAVEALPGGIHVQWHGMADATCPNVDVYITEGTDGPVRPGSAAGRLAGAAAEAHPDWRVRTHGAPCPLHGSQSIQGHAVREGGGQFVHVEAAPGMRSAAAWYGPVAAAWPDAYQG